VEKMKAQARHKGSSTWITGNRNLETAINKLNEIGKILDIDEEPKVGTYQYEQMAQNYKEQNIRIQQGLLWYLVRSLFAEEQRLYKKIGKFSALASTVLKCL
jgi:hypothetical protein